MAYENPYPYRRGHEESLGAYHKRLEARRQAVEGGAGQPPRGRPPVAPSDYPEDDDSFEHRSIIAQIEEIMDNPELSNSQKMIEIKYLLGITKRRRGR